MSLIHSSLENLIILILILFFIFYFISLLLKGNSNTNANNLFFHKNLIILIFALFLSS